MTKTHLRVRDPKRGTPVIRRLFRFSLRARGRRWKSIETPHAAGFLGDKISSTNLFCSGTQECSPSA